MNGPNSYAGGTTITGGTLSFGQQSSAGATTNILVNGGTLYAAGTMDLSSIPISLGANNGAIGVSGGQTLSYGGIITGPGNLTKNGGGTLVLNNTNTYTGTTTVSAGTLQIDSGSGTGSLPGAGNVVLGGGGTVAYDLPGNLVLNNTVTGNGTLVQMGSGILTLTGTTSDNFNAAVNNGTLVLAMNGAVACNTLNVNGGVAQLAGTGGNQINDGSSITMNGGTLDANGQSETFNIINVDNVPNSKIANSATNSASVLTGTFEMNTPSEVRFDVVAGSTLTLKSSGTPSSINGQFLHVYSGDSGQDFGTTILSLQPIVDSFNGNWTIDSGTTMQMGTGRQRFASPAASARPSPTMAPWLLTAAAASPKARPFPARAGWSRRERHADPERHPHLFGQHGPRSSGTLASGRRTATLTPPR